MKLRPLGSNQTEVEINMDLIVFFSYKTPVACVEYSTYYRTEKRWSVTTSKHINKWLGGVEAIKKPQEFFDTLVPML